MFSDHCTARASTSQSQLSYTCRRLQVYFQATSRDDIRLAFANDANPIIFVETSGVPRALAYQFPLHFLRRIEQQCQINRRHDNTA